MRKETTLNILRTIQPVVDQAGWVSIDDAAVAALAEQLAATKGALPDWDGDLHPIGRDAAETATLVLVLDALNFCFWPLPGSKQQRWTVTYRGQDYDGYMALAVALRRAVEAGVPLTDPDYLANIDEPRVRQLFAPAPGCQEIPLIEQRAEHLREVGRALRDRWNGSFAHAIETANGSAARLIEDVLLALPSFRDTAIYRGGEVRFYKRAQILIADLYGAFGGVGLGAFSDLDRLTAFADYKVPQILRQFGLLHYHRELVATIQRYDLIAPGDEREVEIRAATVWAVDLLRRELDVRGWPLQAYQIDWLLWNAAQQLPAGAEPYHRTLTIYY